jgi:TIR domain
MVDVKTPSASTVPTKTGFLSYAHADTQSVQRLRKPMNPRLGIRNDYHFDLWWDQDIVVGKNWDLAIKSAMDSADFALLLVSPSLFDSGYITKTEIPSLLAHPTCKLIPVGLEFLNFESTQLFGLEDFQVFRHREPQWDKPKFFNDVALKFRGRFCDALIEQLAKRIGEVV